MTTKLLVVAASLLALTVFSTPAMACTDFMVKGTDGTVVTGRSMEFEIDLKADVVIHTRGEKIQSQAPDGKPGLSWVSKYGFAAINSFGMDTACDGMNEQGLTASTLWLSQAKYQQVPEGQEAKAVLINDLLFWILGNFTSTQEVKQAIDGIFVWAQPLEALGGKIPPLHITIHDKTGQSLLIEYVDGQKHIYDNPIGVTTNSPTFDWHLSNLKNYVKLSPENAQPVNINGVEITPAGYGSGWFGMPGDWTPPSRMVRTVALVASALKTEGERQTVNLCNHILAAIDIPLGAIRDTSGETTSYGRTQWVVIKDLTHKKLYFRTYNNMTLRLVDLNELDLSGNTKLDELKMEQSWDVIDVTKHIRFE